MKFVKWGTVVLSCLVVQSLSAQITIAGQRELFVDDYLIESLHKVDNRLATPVREEVSLKFDAPWEGVFSGAYVSVTFDGSMYRMYYRGIDEKGGIKDQVTCCAESRDGIHWVKPAYNQFFFKNTYANNIVLLGDQLQASHNFSVIYDNNPAALSRERYKAVGGVASSVKRKMRGLYRYTSPDGIHWSIKDSIPLFPDGYGMDSQNVLAWLPEENLYAIYLRRWTEDKPGDTVLLKGVRTIARSVSKDFINWSKPEPMSFGETEIEDLYTNATQPYFRAPQLSMAMPFRFSPNEVVLTPEKMETLGIAKTMRTGISDAVLMTSRGGNSYQRKFLESFIRPGLNEKNWAARSNIPALGIVPTGKDSMSIYVTRAYGTNDCHMERLSLRLDGFASLHAGFDEGYAITRPVKLKGKEFLINYSTSTRGYVKVVLLDQKGKEIDGFTEEDAILIRGDQIDKAVTWKKKTMADLNGKTVRIKFILKDADLYSFAIF